MSSTRLTPTEKLLLALLRLHPSASAQRLIELTGSKTSKHVRASLRVLVLAGLVAEETTETENTYKVVEVEHGL
jgi:predicted transcriptional regulator